MPEIISLDRVVQVGVEATYGVAVPTTKQLQTLKLMPDVSATGTPFVAQGGKYTSVMTLGKEWTTIKMDGQPSYGEMVYPFSSIFGAATIATPALGTVTRTWTWSLSSVVGDVPKSFTLETGDANFAERVAGLVINGVNLSFARDKIAVTGTGIAQQTNAASSLTALTSVSAVQTLSMGAVTAGTFTLSYLGQTTGAIQWNATAAAVQAALVALSTIGAGNVVCSGGPFPGTAVVVTFQGNLGNQAVAALTHTDALTGGVMTITQTTTGVSITPEPTAQVVVPNQIDLFLDTSSGSLGTTRLLRGWTVDWSILDKYQPEWPLNSTLSSFVGVTEKAPKAELKITLASDTQGVGLLTAIRGGTTQFARILATGPIIEGTLAYSMTFDLALKVKSVGAVKDFEGIFTREFTADIAHDYGWGKALNIVLQNKIAAL